MRRNAAFSRLSPYDRKCVTSAHWLAVIPARVAGVDALDGPRPLLHDEARGAAEGDGGAQLIGDVAAAEIPVGDVRLPAVFIIEGFGKGKDRVAPHFSLMHDRQRRKVKESLHIKMTSKRNYITFGICSLC